MLFCLQAEETYNDAMSSGFGAFMMNEDENTGKYLFDSDTDKKILFQFVCLKCGAHACLFHSCTITNPLPIHPLLACL